MALAEPLIDDKFLLVKYPGKGGWTYTVLPATIRKNKTPFGWVQVSGYIDDFELKAYRLMPMSSGQLFLPVKSDIRKKISKQAGDWVHVKLFADAIPADAEQDLLLCLNENKEAHNSFLNCSDEERQAFIQWIASARNEQIKLERIAQTLDMLECGQRLPAK